jgi:AcrR family transcriptional regulator
VARPRLHDDALRRRLLEVTSQVVSAGGPEAVTVRDVAARADTSASAVYALFGSRDALLAAVVEEGYRRFADHLAAAPRGDDPRADLLALGLAYRRSALAEPHFYRVMFGGLPGADDREPPVTDRATFRVLERAVALVLAARAGARGQADDAADAGRSPADPAAPEGAPPAEAAREAALALWALVHGLVSLEISGLVPGTDQERADRYARTLGRLGGALLG